MYKFLTFKQLIISAALVASAASQGQSTLAPKKALLSAHRTPASYIPDDDLIVKPVDNQLSFYQQYVASDNSDEVVKSRNQLKVWSDNQQFADQYGLDTTLTGSAYVPTSPEKWEYFKNKYMRYLRSKGEQPLRDMPKTWYQDYRASNEVDTINELEAKFKNKNSDSVTDKHLPEALKAKEVSLWKETRIIFQPRLDQGLVIIGFKNPFVYARAWVGVNGKTELNVQKQIDSIGFSAMYNYEALTGTYFTSVDQRIVNNVYARATSSRDPLSTTPNDNTLMLLYAKQF